MHDRFIEVDAPPRITILLWAGCLIRHNAQRSNRSPTAKCWVATNTPHMPIPKCSPFHLLSHAVVLVTRAEQECLAQTVVEDQALDAATPELGSRTKLRRLRHNCPLRTGVAHFDDLCCSSCAIELITTLRVAQEARRFCLACTAPFHARDSWRTYQEVC